MIIQQGDVLLKEVQDMPEKLIKRNTNILHQGLNHTHIIKGDFVLYEEAKTNYIHATEELINKRGTEEESFWVKEVKRTMTQFLKLDTRLHNAK
jgi:hypothetical protein